MPRGARLFAIVPAAGRGERFGGRRPKQYVALLGRPVLSWSLGALLAVRSVRAVIVALSEGDRRFARLPEARDPRVRTCRGGARRELSVANALEALGDEARDEDWVMVHDAARPCLRPSDVRRLLATLRHDPVGGLLAVPLGDTLKAAGADGRCDRTVPREGLWRALTPQMFRYGVLRAAFAQPGALAATDEAQAVEALAATGACSRPWLVTGSTLNIKVTYPGDLALAAAILAAQDGRP